MRFDLQPYVLSRRTTGANRDCVAIKRDGEVLVSLCQTGHLNSVCKKPSLTETRPFCLNYQASAPRPCPRGWFPSEKGYPSCYQKQDRGMRWLQGVEACQQAGAQVVSWSDDDTRSDVLSICGRTVPGRCTVGLSDREQEGNWKWEDGAPLPADFEPLDNRRAWDHCAKLEPKSGFPLGKLSSMGCNGEAAAGNLHAICRLGMGAGVNYNFSDIVTVRDVPRSSNTGQQSHETGKDGSLQLANGPYTVNSNLHIVVSYYNSSASAPAVQFFQIVMVPAGGGAPQVLRELAVGNGQAVVVDLGNSIPPGATIKLLHSEPAGQQPGQPGSSALYTVGTNASTTSISIPGGGGLDNMRQVPTPVVLPSAGVYEAGDAVLRVSFDGETLPGNPPTVLYTLDGTTPVDGGEGVFEYLGNTTLPSSSGNEITLVVKAFKTGFAASNETRVTLRINDAGCSSPTGLFCTQACSSEYFWCVSGKRIANQPVAPGTLCYGGELVHSRGRQCSAENTPTAMLTPRPAANASQPNTPANPAIPGNCSGFVPSDACVGKSDDFYCLDECSERRNCMYQCASGTVAQQLNTPAGTVCAQGRISNARNEYCGWAGSTPASADWMNCDAVGPSLLCAGQNQSCSDRFFECRWGGFVPAQPVAPGTMCHTNPSNGNARIVSSNDAVCTASQCSEQELGVHCGAPTSPGSSCSYTVRTCSNEFGQAQRTEVDLREGSSPLVCESHPGVGNDSVVPASQAQCGSPEIPVYSSGACTAETAARNQVVVCDSECSTTYTACSGLTSVGVNLPVANGTLCLDGRLVHDYTCENREPMPTLDTEEVFVNETEPEVPQGDIIRPSGVVGGNSQRRLGGGTVRGLQNAPSYNAQCIGVSLGILRGAGDGFGTVEGQAIVRSSIADIAGVAVSDVRIVSGDYLTVVSVCGAEQCPAQGSGSSSTVPVALPSLVSATAPQGSLSAPLALPNGVSASDSVQLTFDVCNVPTSRSSAVQTSLADGNNYNIGSAVEVGADNIRPAQGGADAASSDSDDDSGLGVGAIVGIALGAVVFIVAVVLVVAFLLVRRDPDAVARRSSKRFGSAEIAAETQDVELTQRG